MDVNFRIRNFTYYISLFLIHLLYAEFIPQHTSCLSDYSFFSNPILMALFGFRDTMKSGSGGEVIPSAALASLPVLWLERAGLDVSKAGEAEYLTSVVAQGEGRLTRLPFEMPIKFHTEMRMPGAALGNAQALVPVSTQVCHLQGLTPLSLPQREEDTSSQRLPFLPTPSQGFHPLSRIRRAVLPWTRIRE